MKFDLHVHTTLSPCSSLTLPQILAEARAKSLDGVCITDHDTIEAQNMVQEGIQNDGLCVICGMEYATPEGDFLIFGPFPSLPQGLTAAELLRLVGNDGGVAVAAHPFRAKRPTQEHIIAQGLCHIVEGVNGRNQNAENQQVSLWKERYGVRRVGGSDAHTLEELGRVTTRFHHPIKSRMDFINALKTGSFSMGQ